MKKLICILLAVLFILPQCGCAAQSSKTEPVEIPEGAERCEYTRYSDKQQCAEYTYAKDILPEYDRFEEAWQISDIPWNMTHAYSGDVTGRSSWRSGYVDGRLSRAILICFWEKMEDGRSKWTEIEVSAGDIIIWDPEDWDPKTENPRVEKHYVYTQYWECSKGHWNYEKRDTVYCIFAPPGSMIFG